MDRRKFLAGSAIFLSSGFSGCMGVLGGGGGSDSLILGGKPQGLGYKIELNPNADIREIRLLNPSGEVVVEEQISTGQRAVKLNLVQIGDTNMGRGVTAAYRVGDYTVVVVGSGGYKQTFPITFEPAPFIEDIRFPSNITELPEINGVLATNTSFAIQFGNEGNAPAIITDSTIQGSLVPNPLPPKQERDYSDSSTPYGAAMFRYGEKSSISRDSIAVPAGKKTWFRINWFPAAIPIAGIPSQTATTQTPSDIEMSESIRPAYSNTSAVREDYVNTSIQAEVEFSSATGGVSTEIEFIINGRIGQESEDGTEYYYFDNQRVTGVDGGRRGLT